MTHKLIIASVVFLISLYIIAEPKDASAAPQQVSMTAFTALRASHTDLQVRVKKLEDTLTRILNHVKLDNEEACFPMRLNSAAGKADCKCCVFVQEQ